MTGAGAVCSDPARRRERLAVAALAVVTALCAALFAQALARGFVFETDLQALLPQRAGAALEQAAGEAGDVAVEFELQELGLQVRGGQAGAGLQGIEAHGVVAQGTQQRPFVVLACRRIFLCWHLQVQRLLHVGRGQTQFFQHVLCRLHQFRALFDERVAAFGLCGMDRPGDGHDVATLLQGLFGGDERARLQGRFNHQRGL